MTSVVVPVRYSLSKHSTATPAEAIRKPFSDPDIESFPRGSLDATAIAVHAGGETSETAARTGGGEP